MLTSCLEENTNHLYPVEGDIKFYASVKNTRTKTAYGDIAEDGKSQAVNWVHNDQITVYGACCGIDQADYAVSVNTVDGDGNTIVNSQNYANSLDKVGSAGVQWGNVLTTDFYAVYPSTSGQFEAEYELSADGTIVRTKSASVTAHVSAEQKVYFTMSKDGDKTIWKGRHYANDIHNPSSPSALMYACTSGAESTDENGNPKAVDLQFKPFTTVLRFNFAGYVVGDAGDVNVNYTSSVYVNEIVLTAPSESGVAGDFTLTINNDSNKTAFASQGNIDIIRIIPSSPIPLENSQRMEFDVFTIPQSYDMNGEDKVWKVTLKTSGGDHTFTMIPKDATGEQTSARLLAGKIHNIGIPTLSVNRPAIQVPNDSWLQYVPRNVYLSEISLPGAWYSTNPDYQGNVSLEQLYNSGVRAFNIDCRMTSTADSWERKWLIITYYEQKSNPTYVLQCAGSETFEGQKVGSVERVSNVADGKYVESQLEALAECVKEQEFIVVVLTIAEQPKGLTGAISNETETFGNNVNPDNVLAAIKDILDRRGKDLKVFGYRDQDVVRDDDGNIVYDSKGNPVRKTISANTTVDDLLGSMLIKVNVNVDQDVIDLSSYGLSNVLLTEGSMASEDKYTANAEQNANLYPNVVLGSFNKMNEAPMYWGTSLIEDPTMMYYYHHAQKTVDDQSNTSGGATPSFYDRIDAIDDILDKSYSIYKKESHNGIFQLGIGGRLESDDRTKVAQVLNKHVLDKVNEKLVTEPSPVGIVLMNYCINPSNGSYYGPELVKAILEMNKKFYLNRNPEEPEWPDGNNPFDSASAAQSSEAAYVTVSGNAFN